MRQLWSNPNGGGSTAEYTWYTAKPGEISLVDSPSLKAARFEFVKADGSKELRAFVKDVGSIVAEPDPEATQVPSPGPVFPSTGLSNPNPEPAGQEKKCSACGAAFKAPHGDENLCPKCSGKIAAAIRSELNKAAKHSCPGAKPETPSRMSDMEASFERLLSLEEAAELLGIHPETLRRMAVRGEVPALKVGRFWKFRASALDEWVLSRLHYSSLSCRDKGRSLSEKETSP